MARTKQKKSHVGLTIFLVLVLLIGLGVIMVWKGFVIKNVEVKGNEVYADKKIEEFVLSDEYSWNSLYVYLKYKFTNIGDLPFVDSVEVELKDPQSIVINVVEKATVGYAYVPETAKYVYFDREGFVLEEADTVVRSVPKVCGLKITAAVLYEKMEIENIGMIGYIANAYEMLDKHGDIPTTFVLDGTNLLLDYGELQVSLGMEENLNEKLNRFEDLKEIIGDRSGTLHLETWAADKTDAFFSEGELSKIPRN